jgi:hypothetical protein
MSADDKVHSTLSARRFHAADAALCRRCEEPEQWIRDPRPQAAWRLEGRVSDPGRVSGPKDGEIGFSGCWGERSRASLSPPLRHGSLIVGAGDGSGFVKWEARPSAKAVQARKWKPRPQRSGAGPKPRRLQERRKCAEGLWAALVGGNV